ncbi:hypothetical protein Pyn_35904 [Prunus yedoensis var. nudiflora]|uniref:Uncharacterized protein n=1 Tax=Prunus yedoensis var. nudiflora TaxID=2094558 RepID=A0A314ULA6_PRUYE|nr:hypothetical protein Pyn_35904 [Prunus yedoensis var. nudiflora]
MFTRIFLWKYVSQPEEQKTHKQRGDEWILAMHNETLAPFDHLELDTLIPSLDCPFNAWDSELRV